MKNMKRESMLTVIFMPFPVFRCKKLSALVTGLHPLLS
jgi:hypothetical protein